MKTAVIVTARQVSSDGEWEEFCNITGLSYWCMNEGQLDPDTEFTLTFEEAQRCRLAPEGWA